MNRFMLFRNKTALYACNCCIETYLKDERVSLSSAQYTEAVGLPLHSNNRKYSISPVDDMKRTNESDSIDPERRLEVHLR